MAADLRGRVERSEGFPGREGGEGEGLEAGFAGVCKVLAPRGKDVEEGAEGAVILGMGGERPAVVVDAGVDGLPGKLDDVETLVSAVVVEEERVEQKGVPDHQDIQRREWSVEGFGGVCSDGLLGVLLGKLGSPFEEASHGEFNKLGPFLSTSCSQGVVFERLSVALDSGFDFSPGRYFHGHVNVCGSDDAFAEDQERLEELEMDGAFRDTGESRFRL